MMSLRGCYINSRVLLLLGCALHVNASHVLRTKLERNTIQRKSPDALPLNPVPTDLSTAFDLDLMQSSAAPADASSFAELKTVVHPPSSSGAPVSSGESCQGSGGSRRCKLKINSVVEVNIGGPSVTQPAKSSSS